MASAYNAVDCSDGRCLECCLSTVQAPCSSCNGSVPYRQPCCHPPITGSDATRACERCRAAALIPVLRRAADGATEKRGKGLNAACVRSLLQGGSRLTVPQARTRLGEILTEFDDDPIAATNALRWPAPGVPCLRRAQEAELLCMRALHRGSVAPALTST